MKLLILTQAVDLDDPVLSFFHRWIEEFATHCQSVHVICLKEGRRALPKHVFVHSLGKERGRSRIKYIFNFYRYIWQLRKEYDSVFVHMNSEYIVLGGLLWRLWKKKISLWFVHKKKNLYVRIALRFSNDIFTASQSTTLPKISKVHVIGHGIDTDAFTPAQEEPPATSLLFFGRLDPVKKVVEFMRALELAHRQGVVYHADIVGSPTIPHSAYARDVALLAAPLERDGVVHLHAGVNNTEAAKMYREHSLYVNLTPTGSFDKTILEAMASGCVCVVANEGLRGVVASALIVDPDAPRSVTDGIRAAFALEDSERREIGARNRLYVEQNHALSQLVGRIISSLSSD